ncbi:NlpC/P60 family protein [Metabacillus fastidiosus]|uniref:NlpC/P60 family protein n=1 Tax=Metabacillus fastidiosus TaxID=1458 RepID=UPI003D2BA449
MKKYIYTFLLLCPILLLTLSVNKAMAATKEEQFIENSKKYLGIPYKFGGTTPKAFDCSGYLGYVFKEYGYSLPRTVAGIYSSKNFSPVKELQVGDIVFFTTYKKGASHAGIYIGQDQFIHAASSNGVSINKLQDSYWKNRYIGAKRHSLLSNDLNSPSQDEVEELWKSGLQHYMSENVTMKNEELLKDFQEIRTSLSANDRVKAEVYLTKTANLIDSVNLAAKLEQSTNELKKVLIENQQLDESSVALYHSFSEDIRKSEKVYSRLSGSDLRKRFNQESITPAKISKETVIYEVSMYGLLKVIEDTVAQGNVSEAQSLLEKYNRLENRASEIKILGNSIHENAYNNLETINAQLKERKSLIEKQLPAVEKPEAKEEAVTPAA